MGSYLSNSTYTGKLLPVQLIKREQLINECPSCPSREDGFCSRFEEGLHSHLLRSASRTTVAQDATLSTHFFHIIRKGIVRFVHHGVDGKRRIVGLSLPGEVLLPDETTPDIGIEAATALELCRISEARYREQLHRFPQFREQVFIATRARRDSTLRLASLVGRLTPEQRICSFLAACTRFMPWQPLPGGGGILTMELGRPDIAALLATTPETVCRMLHSLDSAKVIGLRGPKHFEIASVERLCTYGRLAVPEDLAGFV